MYAGRMSAGGRSSIRFLSIAVLAAVGLLALGTVGALAVTSTLLAHSADTVARDTRSAVLASEVELDLLLYHRVSRLFAETGEPELGELRIEIARRIHARLGEARVYSRGPAEDALVDDVSGLVVRYLTERVRLEGTGRPDTEVVARTRALLDTTIARLEEWRAMNDGEVARARRDAIAMDRVATIAGFASVGVLFVGLGVVAVGVRRRILRPLFEIHHSITAFRRGDYAVRAPESGPSELVHVARAFNEMRDVLDVRRKEQLAFLAGVAHDLRNPLSALKVSTSTLCDEMTAEERELTRAIMTRQLDQLTRMVDDLLDAHRIEAGELELETTELDLRDVARHVVQLYAPTAPHHDVRLAVPREPVWVRADGLRIEQAVGNLVSNAIKYSPRGGRIEVAIEQVGEQAVVRVSDRGIGIAAEDVERIFAPFQRRARETAAGAGLGLSVVRRIVHAHGGAIDVESRLGEGSRFSLRLPALRAATMRASA